MNYVAFFRGLGRRQSDLADPKQKQAKTIETKSARKAAAKIHKAKKSPKVTDFPSVLNIETTNYCNLECPMCPRTTSMTRPVEHMQQDDFKRLIDEADHHGVRTIWLHMFGEPLLTPSIFEMIDYAASKEKVQTVALSTNVTPLTEINSRKLLESGLNALILSIDASTEDVYSTVRGFDFQKVSHQAWRFLEMHRETNSDMNIEISIINMVMKENEIDDFIAKWSKFESDRVKILVKTLTNFGGQVDLVALGEPAARHSKEASRTRCRKLWASLTVMSNGEAVACCYDVNGTMRYGNIRDRSLHEIWHSNEVAQLRAKHDKLDFTDLPLCNDCDATWKSNTNGDNY